ncbi:MAG: hypothetical protein ABSH28_02945 [Acidobacteriota bacterium]
MRMKTFLVSAIVLIAFCGTALAQENAPRAEIFGGYSYMRTADGANTNGWNLTPTYYFNTWLGLAGNLAGHYQTQPSSAAAYTFFAGPQIAHSAGKITGFGHVFIGGAHVGDQFDLISGGVRGGHNGFAMAFGGGVDVSVAKKIAVRVVQVDYERIWVKNPSTFQNAGTNNVRLSFGIVLKTK